MAKTKEQSPTPAPVVKQPEPTRRGPEPAPTFSTAARSNGVPAAASAAALLTAPQSFGGAGVRARLAGGMQRSVGNSRMGRMMGRPPVQQRPTTAGASPSAKIPSATGSLPEPVQETLEDSFGVPVDQVRVHSDASSAQAAKGLRARAFAHGQDVFLGPGESPNDVGLMAHEVAHVIQQGGGPRVQRSAPGQNDVFEHEAHRASAAAVSREPFTVSERTDGPRTQFWGVGDALDFFANKANLIPGFRMFTIVLGVNPINMTPVERNAANVLRAVVEFIPGGALITDALDNYGVFDKVGKWVEQQIASLGIIGSSIKAAVTKFLDSLSWTDVFSLDDVWERAKRIFTDPIDRIKSFVKGLITEILAFIRDAILQPIAALAVKIPGWDLLTAVLGKNPITGDEVPRTADTLIGGFMKLIGEEEVWNNIKKANALERCWAWFKNALNTVLAYVQQVPSLFMTTLKSLTLEDLVFLPKAFIKVGSAFGSFAVKFISWAGEAVWNLLQIIFEVLAPAAIPYLKKVGAAFKTILKNPMVFVGNLVKAAKQGFMQFVGNIGAHLKASFIEWLTGSMPGVYIPKSFDFKEIVKFALSVLGLSWANIRQKLVKAVGETAVKAMEVGFDIVKTLVTEGPAAAWEKIKEQLANLKDMVIQGIMDFIIETVVKKAIVKIVSFLIPGAGFIQAILTTYDTILVFIDKLKKIIQVAVAFLDSVMAIASGAIGAAANKVESTMAGLLTLAISFLAGFVGLGRVADKVMEILKTKVWAPIDKALDFVITWIVNTAKKLFAKIFGKGDKPDERTDQQKQADLDKGISEAEAAQSAPRATEAQIKKALLSIKQKYKMTSLELVVDGRNGATETVHVEGEINPKRPGKKAEIEVVEGSRGTLQIQGGDITKGNPGAKKDQAAAQHGGHGYMVSFSWARMEPPAPISAREGRQELAKLWKSLEVSQQHRRFVAYYKAIDWINQSLGNSPPGRKGGEHFSYQDDPAEREDYPSARVDVVVSAGLAFDR
jgi:hypothetical protein